MANQLDASDFTTDEELNSLKHDEKMGRVHYHLD